jgi:hypothetical protein
MRLAGWESDEVPRRCRAGATTRRSAIMALTAAGTIMGMLGGMASCSSDPREGYAFNAAYDSGIRSIAVPVFDNQTFSLEVPIEVTESIIKELQRVTPWAVTASDRADTILRGVVTRVDMRKLAQDPNSGFTQETAITVTIDFDWIDSRSGKTLLSRRSYTGTDTFTPTRGTGERMEVGQRGAIQRLAADVVGEMRKDGW